MSEFDDMIDTLESFEKRLTGMERKLERLVRTMREAYDLDDSDFEMTDIDE